MPVTSFCESHTQQVLTLRDATFGSTNLSQFAWQPCQQVESLDQQCFRAVFKDGQDIKGYGAAYRLDDTHFRLNLIVDPHYRRQGIGSQLLKRVEQEVVNANGKYLQARAFEAMPASLRFALANGFKQIHIMRGMTLRAAGFSFGKWKELGQRLSAKGLALTTLKSELEAGANAIDKLAQLYKLVRDGWPSPDPSWRLDTSPDALRAQFTEVKEPEYFSIIKDHSEYIGFTSAKNLASGTGVHPGYRNLGVATYLKAFDINRCIEAGAERFESSTASPAMQRVNEKLGYRLNGLSEVRFVKELPQRST